MTFVSFRARRDDTPEAIPPSAAKYNCSPNSSEEELISGKARKSRSFVRSNVCESDFVRRTKCAWEMEIFINQSIRVSNCKLALFGSCEGFRRVSPGQVQTLIGRKWRFQGSDFSNSVHREAQRSKRVVFLITKIPTEVKTRSRW